MHDWFNFDDTSSNLAKEYNRVIYLKEIFHFIEYIGFIRLPTNTQLSEDIRQKTTMFFPYDPLRRRHTWNKHHIDIIGRSWRLKSPLTGLFVQPLVQTNNDENTNVPHYWAFVKGIHQSNTNGFPSQMASNLENESML